MEVVVDGSDGVPEGCVLSIRAGTKRLLGDLSVGKPMKFDMALLDANPFTVEVLKPLARKRVTVRPNGDSYTLSLEKLPGVDGVDAPAMTLNLGIHAAGSKGANGESGQHESRQARKVNMANETQAYIERHRFVEFLQNFMQSVLAEKPEDPFEYMEQELKATRSKKPPKKEEAKPAASAPRKQRAPKKNLAPKPKTFQGTALVVEDDAGVTQECRPLCTSDLMDVGAEIRRFTVSNLADKFTSKLFKTPLAAVTRTFQGPHSVVTEGLVFGKKQCYYQMLRAGPREVLHFDPRGIVASIVICGGLCPGLNSMIRELVIMLKMYGVKRVWGIQGGFNGVVKPETWIALTPENVQDIHDVGGSIILSDRGNPTEDDQAAVLKSMGVKQHYILGGDGTLIGAHDTAEVMGEMGWECTVVGIPKTVDNDIPMMDRTFGFDTVCTEAIQSILMAYTEAASNANCIGLVKLMGRSSGFIAMEACLAAQNVDVCLLPEMKIDLEKVLNYCLEVMQKKGRMVIVVSEGCGDTLVKGAGDGGGSGKRFTRFHSDMQVVQPPDVGPWLRDQLMSRFKQMRLPLTIKYIDPTYMVRSVKANANDSVYCTILAHNAVHAAMAGYTDVIVGRLQQRYVVMPIEAITRQPPKRVDLKGRQFLRLQVSTRQADFTPEGWQVPPTPHGSAQKGISLRDISIPIRVVDIFNPGDEIRRLALPHLKNVHGHKEYESTLDAATPGINIGSSGGFRDDQSFVTQTLGRDSQNSRNSVYLQMLLAGPRAKIYFDPPDVAAAIITCGGLCPGLNTVIREIVMLLWMYGVKKVYGITGGYKGVCRPQDWLTLTPDNVKDIHRQGGTLLKSDRGNPTEEEQFEYLRAKGIRQYFIVGGDGTHLGAMDMADVMKNANYECSVVGIPKTIDNDLPLLDQTFGFDTAMTEANKSIDVAYIEASCNANCIGLVKLMGRHCGWLTMMSVVAARRVDVCLLPEMHVSLDKTLDYLVHMIRTRGNAVIVIAEGCADTLMQNVDTGYDAGGNKLLPEVGMWMKDQILDHFKQQRVPCTVKYVDPTYSVRAVPANANDSIYCSSLSAAAVNGAMAGYTSITVAKIDENFVMLPIKLLVGMPNKKVDTEGRWFERLLATTKQPSLVPDDKESAYDVWKRQASHQIVDETQWQLTVPDTELVVQDGYGDERSRRPLERRDMLRETDQIRALQCIHLGDRFGRFKHPTPFRKWTTTFSDDDSWCTQAMYSGQSLNSADSIYYQMVRAGPREYLHFDPHDPAACAAIVSCGGICPGLNPVIREIVMTLWQYGVRRIWGIKGGYKGVMDPESWIKLTPEIVKDIHLAGGTMLISDRGNPPHIEMAKVLRSMDVKQYFVLGGDGTHKGAMQTFDCCEEIGYECAIVGVPKTIDNDVPIFDQTFGFDTACTEAIKAVDSAYVEACCNANAIGLVKLMGRHCGFIAMNAALAARHVDICLLPEMDIDLEKVLQHTIHLMKTKGSAVIVIAEGCGGTMIKEELGADAGGNKVLADIGPWFKDSITARFKQEGIPLTIKYIDPTYMIRSIPANAFDSAYCSALAQNAVHGAMAGYAGITVGKVYERMVYVPIHSITKQEGRRVNPKGRWFSRLLETTGQPDVTPDHELTPRKSSKTKSIMEALSVPRSINDILSPGTRIVRLELVHLADHYPSEKVPNQVVSGQHMESVFLDEESWSTKTFTKMNKFDDQGHTFFQLLRSGPRKELFFDPSKGNACIVTCGGLCPGLNSVIREVVNTLTAYGVQKIYGCVGGYKGMVQPETWLTLTPESVQDIHNKGGTILVSDRGNPPHIEIAKTLQKMNVKQYFVIGGDGTQMGAFQTFEQTQVIDYEVAVVGIPKTIDNDIPIMDKSFGFNTACTEAEKAIDSAYVESLSKENCLGLVKLMGRSSGFIALEATLAARTVDICLLPEMNISLPKLLTYTLQQMKQKKHLVMVVAEGCGDTLLESAGATDAGGNKIMADVGPWLMEQLHGHFKKHKEQLTIRYVDPTYMIRAVPANPSDSVYCSVLAQHAVHGAMAGYTGITVGKVDERYVMLPIHSITKKRGRKVDLKGRQFERLLASTGQVDFTPSIGDDWALMKQLHPPPTHLPEGLCTAKPLEMPNIDSLEVKPNDPPIVDFSDAKITIFEGFEGKVKEERALKRNDLIQDCDTIRCFGVQRCSDKAQQKIIKSPLKTAFLDDESWVLQSLSTSDRVESVKGAPYFQLLRAGPREYLNFDPFNDSACAAICTSGCVCPGENVVIREIYNALQTYGVKHVFGVRNGFGGIQEPENWFELDGETVQDIHNEGGTILRNARSYPEGDTRRAPNTDTVAALKEKNVRQLFILGGDGSHRGVSRIFKGLQDLGHECAIITVPSTVDNDIPLTDVTFGFNTACAEARNAIDCAYVEARCNANAIGLVKLSGAKSGHVVLQTTLASRHVDICLIPEMSIDLDKLLNHCEHLMATKGYAVVVVAEGCNTPLCLNTGEDPKDVDIGQWLKAKITERFKQNSKPLTIKYIDPTYMIRSTKGNANDSVFCSDLASHAVHGAMAGFTGVSVLKAYERYVYMPIEAIVYSPERHVNPKGRWFARLCFTTGQPSFDPDEGSPACRTMSNKYSVDNLIKLSTPTDLAKILKPGFQVERLEILNLSEKFPSRNVATPLKTGELRTALVSSGNAWCTQTIMRKNAMEEVGGKYFQFMRSGPRQNLHFDPQEEGATAAIVTCGGLCPGLNSVIREIVKMLKAYGVKTVYGIKGGYKGCVQPDTWIELTEKYVQDIHMKGGSVLVSDRGNPPHAQIAASLKSKQVRWYFVLGGDGTHQGAMETFEAMTELGYECAVCGVPKTIDNDIQMLDRTFGFDTAVMEAERAIDSAYVEATTNANCIGLVKLMGRHCGWIAAMGTLAARHVDVCLIPEMSISMQKLCAHVSTVLKRKKYAVVVVAEGCGDTMIDSSEMGKDAGGNKMLADVGPYLKDQLTAHCKKDGIPVTIKYIDPTYMIRSVPANAFDSMYCSTLAQQAVHGVMAGFTGFTVGKVDERYVMLPVHSITRKGPRVIDRNGRTFERLLATTQQPSFEP
eukprot:TRINITY_DN860_c0_g4_i1.p1 TRINITY_DN860_c0_g4~~TRINITY_DN860_c0_g4_i1.p1  ORF type:complete len:3066 (-),score=802.16 TRINITY_DN860_c0_g4_i1:310-9507(-)